MEIGNMKHRITIQKPKISKDTEGFEKTSYSNYKTVWAAVSNLFGREYYTAMQVQAEKTIKFTIRYTSDINESMRIVFNKKSYDITFIDNIKYGNAYMEIKALLVEVI